MRYNGCNVKKKKNNPSRLTGFRGLLIAQLTLLGLFVAFLVFAFRYFSNTDIPQFFPFNEQNGLYTVTKSSPDSPFEIRYTGPGACCLVDSAGYVTITVGATTYDLQPLIGKAIYILKGAFVHSDQQCVAGKCRSLGGPYAVVNIGEMVPVASGMSPRPAAVVYTVQQGDSLESVAQKWDISMDTIRWANNLTDDSVVPGQALRILPVTGIAHTVAHGDTLKSVAAAYKTNPQKIIDFPYNTFADKNYTLVTGSTIMVPDGVKQ